MEKERREQVGEHDTCVVLAQYEEALQLTTSLFAKLRRRTKSNQRAHDPSVNGDGNVSRLTVLANELMTQLKDFQPNSRELLALKAEIVTIKQEHEPEAEPAPSLKKPVIKANTAEKVRTIAPHQSTSAPTNDLIVDSRSDEIRGRSSVVDMIKQLNLRVIAVEKDHCDPMWGTASIIIASEVVQETSDAVIAVVDKLRGVEMTMTVARSLLDLLGAFRRIRHPFLTEILVSPISILQTLVYRLPNSIAGMEQVGEPTARDTAAIDCFTVAIDLLTTLDNGRRMELVGQAMATLRRDFEPRVVLRRSTHEKLKRLCKHDTKLNVTWAGRLLLLCAHVVAHVIATQDQTHVDDFLDVLQAVGDRHAMFPGLFQRCHKIITTPTSTPIEAGGAPVRSCSLKLKHEERQIREMCARFSDERLLHHRR